MNEPVEKKQFASKFENSKLNFTPENRNLARSVFGALSIAAMSFATPSLASNNINHEYPNQNLKSEAITSPQQSNIETAQKLSFDNFKNILKEGGSGVYAHPFDSDQVVTLLLQGDSSATEKINRDWLNLKGAELPSSSLELVSGYQDAFNGDLNQKEKQNSINYIKTPSNEDINFITLGIGGLENKSDKDLKLAYYSLMFQAGLSAAPQKMDAIDVALNKMSGVGDVGFSNSANFASVLITAKELMNSGYSNNETLSFMEELKRMNDSSMSKVLPTEKNSFYSGQAATNLAINMIKQNPEKIKDLSLKDLESMSDTIISLTESHDFSNDEKAKVLLESNNSRLLSQTEILNNLKSDPKAYQGAMRTLIKELDTVLDGLIKQQYGDTGVKPSEDNRIDHFVDFNAGALAKLIDEGLWEQGGVLEPEFKIEGLSDPALDTEVLEIILENTDDIKAVVWEPGVDRTPYFLDEKNQNVIDIAKSYSFDFNNSPDSKRIDLFFKDEGKTTISLTMDNSCVTPEFFDESVRLLGQERFDNISRLKECDSPQLNGDELKKNYSSYNQHELIIREIDYSQKYDDSKVTSDNLDVGQDFELELDNYARVKI